MHSPKLLNKGASPGKELTMDEMGNQTEELIRQTEQKMLYKILDIIRDCKFVEEVETKIRTLLNK